MHKATQNVEIEVV